MIRIPLSWLEKFNRWGLWKRPVFLTTDIAEAPDENSLPANLVVREVRDGYEKWAHFKCPRCAEHIQLPLAGREHWTIRIDWLRRPTLSPSVWQTGSCQAHFFLRQGNIEWCVDSPSPSVRRTDIRV
jgi:hypothetical protein